MNLSGNPGIVHPMHIPPTFGHPPIPAIHPRLGTLQLTNRAPAAELDDALRRAVVRGEVGLFVVPGPVTAFVDCL